MEKSDHWEYQQSKTDKLNQLKQNNKEPIIELLRYGLTDNEASLLEASLIDYIGLNQLTNKVRGLHSRSLGRNTIQDIILEYKAKEATIDEFVKVPIINLYSLFVLSFLTIASPQNICLISIYLIFSRLRDIINYPIAVIPQRL